MKPGRRALGVAESYRGRDDDAGDGGRTTSTLAGAVVRADRVVDDFVFGSCTVGGLDATDAIVDCWRRLERPDVRYVLVAGVAPAWYNVLDLQALHEATDRPVVAVTFEASEGLTAAIEEAFDGDARRRRLEAYDTLPPRRRLTLEEGQTLYVRGVGFEDEDVDVDRLLATYTADGERRPEPLRVAALAARRADAFRREDASHHATGGYGRDDRVDREDQDDRDNRDDRDDG